MNTYKGFVEMSPQACCAVMGGIDFSGSATGDDVAYAIGKWIGKAARAVVDLVKDLTKKESVNSLNSL